MLFVYVLLRHNYYLQTINENKIYHT